MKTQFTIGAFAIIENEVNEILLAYRDDINMWNMPGGAVENGETPWECVVREAKEETGLDVNIERLLGIYSKTESNDLVFVFKCRKISGVLTLNEEAKELRYFSIKEIPSNTIPKQIERINDYINNDKEIIMKKQIGRSVKEMIRDREIK